MKYKCSLVLFFLSSLFLLQSCTSKRKDKIVGKWKWHQVRLKTNPDGSIDRNQKYPEGKHDRIFSFRDDGTGLAEDSGLGRFKWDLTPDRKYVLIEWTRLKVKAAMEIIYFDDTAMVLSDTPYVKSYDGFYIGNDYNRL